MTIIARLLAFLSSRRIPKTAERDSHHYFGLGTQYYFSARAATFAGCFPIAGNLFHHAVEMFLKGVLVQQLSRARLKSYGHNLKRLWKVYKNSNPTVDPLVHDSCVRDLHKFERIRYPDLLTDKGMFGTISVSRPSAPPSMWSADGATLPAYHLVVNDVDQLVRVIFDTASINPEGYFDRVGIEWRALIHRDNPAFPAA